MIKTKKCNIVMIGIVALMAFYFVSSPLSPSIVSADDFDVDNRKAIRVINKDNVDKYKDLLPESLYIRVKEWGLTFNWVPPLNVYAAHKNYIAATKKYAGQCKIGPKGELLNYVAGRPFPDPKTANEIVWNREKRYKGDDHDYHTYTGRMIDRKGHVRRAVSHMNKVLYSGRVNIPPMPVIPNKDGILYKEICMQDFPEEIRGLGVLTIRYLDPDREDAMWMNLPTMRRTRRMSTSQRGDTFGGGDTTWDDYGAYAGKTERNTYKLLAKKEVLLVLHEEKDVWPEHPEDKDEKGLAPPMCPGGNFEKREMYVIEAVSKDPNYVYSKWIWYIDPATGEIIYSEMFDRKGKLWKCIHQRHYMYGDVHYCHTFEEIDMQAKHATIWEVYGYTQDNNPSLNDFSLSGLRSNAR